MRIGLFAVAGAYLVGCFSTAYYLLRLLGRGDIREQGSGTAGARNAGRLVGPGAFAAVLALDVVKGMLPVAAGRGLGLDDGWLGAVAFAVVLGHVVPIQLAFRGGKGVATSLGALALYQPRVLLALAAGFAVGYAVTRRSKPAGAVAYAVAAVWTFWVRGGSVVALWIGLASALVFAAHLPDLRKHS